MLKDISSSRSSDHVRHRVRIRGTTLEQLMTITPTAPSPGDRLLEIEQPFGPTEARASSAATDVEGLDPETGPPVVRLVARDTAVAETRAPSS